MQETSFWRTRVARSECGKGADALNASTTMLSTLDAGHDQQIPFSVRTKCSGFRLGAFAVLIFMVASAGNLGFD
eukprot:3155108-Amphidinium_carterae.1